MLDFAKDKLPGRLLGQWRGDEAKPQAAVWPATTNSMPKPLARRKLNRQNDLCK